MTGKPTWGDEGSVSPFGDGDRSGVRTFWALLIRLAGVLALICLVFAYAIYQGKAFRNIHHVHLSPGLVAIGIVVIGIACLAAAKGLERPLDGSSDSSLLASYRKRFFLWVAFGEIPFFVGVAAAALTGWFWPCLVGTAFAFTGYYRIAPTVAALARDQDRLRGTGSSRSL